MAHKYIKIGNTKYEVGGVTDADLSGVRSEITSAVNGVQSSVNSLSATETAHYNEVKATALNNKASAESSISSLQTDYNTFKNGESTRITNAINSKWSESLSTVNSAVSTTTSNKTAAETAQAEAEEAEDAAEYHAAQASIAMASAQDSLTAVQTIKNYLSGQNLTKERITAINNAADTKLASVLSSIPDDYTTLSNDINCVYNNTEISCYSSLDNAIGYKWDKNVGETAEYRTSSNRMSNATPYNFGNATYKITVNDGYRISYRICNSDKLISYDSGWITGTKIFETTSSQYYCFTSSKLNDASTTSQEIYENISISRVNLLKDSVDNINHDTLVTVTIGSNGKKPYLSKENNSITFYSDTRFWYDGTYYVLEEDVTVSFANSDRYLWCVYLDKTDNTIKSSTFNTYNAVNNEHVLVCICRTDYGYVSINCDYDSDVINNESHPFMLLAMMPSEATPYLTVSTTNKTITIPADTSIFDYNKNDSRASYRNRYNISSNTTVSYAGTGSSLNMLLYNTTDNTISVKKYSYFLTSDYRLLGTIRTTPFTFVVNCPYVIEEESKSINDIVDCSNVKSVAHRGYSNDAPENTIASFKLARDKGFRYVETDVSFTSDGIPVLIHDDTVDRTSSGTGYIRNLTLEQAKLLDFGSWKSSKYTGETIPTLDEFLLLCRNIGLIPRIEIKTPASEQEVSAILDSVSKYGMRDKCEINCNDISVLTHAKQYYSKFTLVYGAGSSASVANTLSALKTDSNKVIWNISYNYVTDNIVNACIDNGIELEVWTVNNENTIKSLNPYISGVTSNYINASKVLYNYSMIE